MRKILETPRLMLREFLPEDADDFYCLSQVPDALTYTGDPPFQSVEATADFLKDYYQYKRYGYGRWALILKETGEFLGWTGLRRSDQMAQTDLGFRLYKKNWGQGYATEAGLGCIRYGFTDLGLTKIVGRVLKDHLASIRVLEKCGMTFVRKIEYEMRPGLEYEIVKKLPQ